MVEEWCQAMTPSPAALIISMIIPKSLAALPDFIFLTALDAISGVSRALLIHSYLQHSIEIPHLKASDDDEIAKLAFHYHF